MDQNFRLNKDDVTAIRKATSYSVDLNRDKEGVVLRCYKRVREDNVFSAERAWSGDKRRRDIVCEAYNEYGNEGHFSSLYPRGAWRVFAQLVREGDRLEFRAGENGNDYVHKAMIPAGTLDFAHQEYKGLFCDELMVTVYRTGKDGREKAIVHDLVLEYSVCPDNLGRAIRPRKQYSLA